MHSTDMGNTTPDILIVEDELLIALDLRSIVEDLGHTVIGPARTLDEALELAEQQAEEWRWWMFSLPTA